MKISCIIPFFNERAYLNDVLSEVSLISNLDEIICIDDGSTDGSSNIVKKFSKIKLIQHETNKGKTEAIRTGVSNASGNYILLIDGDLRNLKHLEFEKALDTAIKEELDMLIFERLLTPVWMKFTKANKLITGERLTRKADLEQILKESITGFELELAINHYMMINRKNVKFTFTSARNVFKTYKYGPLVGIRKEIQMYLEILFLNRGFIKYNYPKQFLTFGKKRLYI